MSNTPSRRVKAPPPSIRFPELPPPAPTPMANAAIEVCPELGRLYARTVIEARIATLINRLVAVGRMELKGRLSDD